MANEDIDIESGKKRRSCREMLVSGFASPSTQLSGSSRSSISLQKTPAPYEAFSECPTGAELQLRQSLISLMVGDQVFKGSLYDSCAWFIEFLEERYKSQRQPLCLALKGLPDQSVALQRWELAVIHNFVVVVAQLLKTKRDLALVEIVDHLDNSDLLKPQFDDQRAIPNQMVFAAIGWLTMLYEAQVNPSQDKLQLTEASMSALGYRHTLSAGRYFTYTQSFQYIDVPLHSLLTRFGDLIPDLGTISSQGRWYGGGRETESIMPQHVCWHTLQKVTELNIEWVPSLGLHLELDTGKRTLKLFRYPSFARMMSCDKRGNLLSQLLNNYAASRNGDVADLDVPTGEFFQELLLSYRVIFGEDERSWKAFSKTMLSEEQSAIASASCRGVGWSPDPMLATLCCKSANSPAAKNTYGKLNVSEPASSYDPNTEFQFFGRRLLELQSFVKQHQPRNLKALLSDRQDLNSWWNRLTSQWLIFLASFTILLVILQLVFQIWQVLLAQQQNTLAQEQLAQGTTRS